MKDINRAVKAVRRLFFLSKSVTCSACGAELKGTRNLARIIKRGCPACGCTKWNFNGLPEEAALKLQAIIPQGETHV